MSAWKKLFDAQTTRAELQTIIAAQADAALNTLLAQVSADPDHLSPAEIADILRLAEPRIRAVTRYELTGAWERLVRAEAAGSPPTTIH